MKSLSKYNLKTVAIVLTVIYGIIMYSLENYILTAIIGDAYIDNFVIYHNAYEMLIWFIPLQLFIIYLAKHMPIKKQRAILVLVSLGLWVYLFAFTFL